MRIFFPGSLTNCENALIEILKVYLIHFMSNFDKEFTFISSIDHWRIRLQKWLGQKHPSSGSFAKSLEES
jgi:hypothetical protein